MKYIALLRGINVGGNRIIKMADLREMFAGFGYDNVQTYIQSGNVIFEAPSVDCEELANTIQAQLAAELGYEVTVFVRTGQMLHDIAAGNPFPDVEISKDRMLYVTFLQGSIDSQMHDAIVAESNEIDLFEARTDEVYALHYRTPGKVPDFDKMIRKITAVATTTRNWNSINKIIAKYF